MLKDLKLINEVVMEQRHLTTMLIAKLYRLLKSTKKLLIDDDYQTKLNLRDFTKNQLLEVFQSLDKVFSIVSLFSIFLSLFFPCFSAYLS